MTHRLTSWRYGTLTTLFMALALMLSLSACSSGGEGESTSSSTATPTDRATTEGIANPTLPERPAAMDNYDEEGAIAAAEYFLRLSLYGVATDNWDEYNALSSSTCEFCISYRDDNHKMWSKASSITMPDMQVEDAVVGSAEDNPKQWIVHLVATQQPNTIIDKDNVVHHRESSTTALAFLLDSSDNWKVLKVEIFEPELFNELYPQNDK